ncbi:MAG: hypothetical protein WBD31_09820 [Rubripirellula sp.]
MIGDLNSKAILVKLFLLLAMSVGGITAAHADLQSELQQVREQFYAAEDRAAEIAEKLRENLGNESAEELTKSLRTQVQKAFELREKMQTLELDAAEANLEAARQQLGRRRQLASAIIEARVAELTQSGDLQWSKTKPKTATDVASDESLEPVAPPTDLVDAKSEGSSAPSAISPKTIFGFTARSLSLAETRSYNKRGKTNYPGGLGLSSIERGTLAATLGMRSGDVLLGINGWQTISYDDLARALTLIQERKIDSAEFYLLRGSQTLVGTLTLSQLEESLDRHRSETLSQMIEIRARLVARTKHNDESIARVRADYNTKLEDVDFGNEASDSAAIRELEDERVQMQAVAKQVEAIAEEYDSKPRSQEMITRINTLIGSDKNWADVDQMLQFARLSTTQQVETIAAKIDALTALARQRIYARRRHDQALEIANWERRQKAGQEELEKMDRQIEKFERSSGTFLPR